MYCENVFCSHATETVLGYMSLLYHSFIPTKGYPVIDSNGDLEYLPVALCDTTHVPIYTKWMCTRWVVASG